MGQSADGYSRAGRTRIATFAGETGARTEAAARATMDAAAGNSRAPAGPHDQAEAIRPKRAAGSWRRLQPGFVESGVVDGCRFQVVGQDGCARPGPEQGRVGKLVGAVGALFHHPLWLSRSGPRHPQPTVAGGSALPRLPARSRRPLGRQKEGGELGFHGDFPPGAKLFAGVARIGLAACVARPLPPALRWEGHGALPVRAAGPVAAPALPRPGGSADDPAGGVQAQPPRRSTEFGRQQAHPAKARGGVNQALRLKRQVPAAGRGRAAASVGRWRTSGTRRRPRRGGQR